MEYIYGVEKSDFGWVVWRFDVTGDQAVRWALRAAISGTVRWLCSWPTARGMAGEQAMQPDNLIVWED